jgi:hypothetical protein
LPHIFLQDATTRSYQIRVFRQPGVQVRVQEATGMQPEPGVAKDTYVDGLGRLVAAYKVDLTPEKPRPSAKLRVTRNRPVTRGFLITTLDYGEEQWLVNVDLSLHISNGIVDSIRFDVPEQLANQVTFEPELPTEVQETTEGGRCIVLARPAEGLRGDTRIRLRSTWQPPDGERMRAPDIRVLDVTTLERFLVVPTRLASQQIAWETSGLQSAALPPELVDASLDIASKNIFQIVGPRPEATLRDVDRVTGAPQVHLADIFLAWRLDGTCYGVATFDLEPARLTETELAVPQHLEIIQVMVAGLPVPAQRAENGNWRLPVGPEQLPQRIEVLFQGQLDLANLLFNGETFAGPALVGLPVNQTLWSVQGPPAMAAGQPRLTHIASDPLSLSQIRAQNTRALLTTATQVLSQSGAREMDTWRSAWQRRLATAERQMQRKRSAGPGKEDSDSSSSSDSSPSSTLDALRVYDAASIWQWQLEPLDSTVHGVLRGSSDSFQVDYASADFRDAGRRGLMATALFALVALFVLVRRNRQLTEWGMRWPYVVGVLLGIVWWLGCTPSLFGLGIILAAVIGAFRPSWATR